MKYYSIRHKKSYYEKYAINSSENYVLICFEDKDLQDSYEIIKKEELENNNFADNQEFKNKIIFDYVGEDNNYYQMNLSDGISQKCRKYSLKKVFKQYKRCEDETLKIKLQKEEIENNYNKSALQKQKSFATVYKKYFYIDREYCIKIPFRLRKSSKGQKRPLVIYMHGAGCAGNDNYKQLFEYLFLNTGLKRKDCHLLIPQCDNFNEDNLLLLNIYSKSIKKLVEELSTEINIDFERIYIIGSSFGGACVWYSIYNNPDFYAAAIPLMGYFVDVYSANFKSENFKKTAIWSGHAVNDKCVSIDDDNCLYEKLHQDGCDIKFSKYSKYGHRMSGVFIRTEKWKKWLFGQSKK